MSLILQRLPWRRVNRATHREVRNREVYCPPISLFRWWARRPHALIGALLEACKLPKSALISDPFSGGGTVAIEAAKRGFQVYAQDLSPWAVWGLRTALSGVCPSKLEAAVASYMKRLQSLASEDYGTTCPEHGAAVVTHTFWVRTCDCAGCAKPIYLFPYSLITLASRSEGERHGYYGCQACGGITKRLTGFQRRVKCLHCEQLLGLDREPLLIKKIVTCPHCDKALDYEAAWSKDVRWKAVLVQRLCSSHDGTQFLHPDLPTEAEGAAGVYGDVPASLKAEIPEGHETGVLRRAGFECWYQIYPPRQLRALLKAASIAASETEEGVIRDRLLLAVLGATEMAGYLCRWDRFHPKAFEALSNHRFSALGLAVETNPLAARGRGTIRQRLAATVRAAHWHQEAIGASRMRSASSTDDRLQERPPEDMLLVTGSSSRQILANGSARLVITDPPYYAALQYGELAGLFIAWSRAVVGEQQNWDTDLSQEVVPNKIRGVDHQSYEDLLTRVLCETTRTLSPRGSLLLTFHSSDFRGWKALGVALHQAGVRIAGIAVARSENEKDHAKRGRRSFSRDLVIECRVGRSRVCDPVVVTIPRTSEERELLAAGQAIARHGGEGAERMVQAFRANTKNLRKRLIEIKRDWIEGVVNGSKEARA